MTAPHTDSPSLKAALKKYFGFDTFKGDQEAIIRNLMDGHDTFVLMPTGGGKSLCYQLPALLMDGTAIVISPLIALMKNQVDAVKSNIGDDGVAHVINSSLPKAVIEEVKADLLAGKTKLLYVAPESLNKESNIELLSKIHISFYAIDEAHCISEWGHDFRPEYRNIRPTIERIGNAPVIALTATATDKVRTDIKKNLGISDARDFKASFNRPNLYYEVRPKTRQVDKDLVRFVKANEGKSGIVYCLSRKKVEEVAELLRINGIKAAPYHAGLDAATRSATQDDFIMERINVIVATIAFGMGIDKPDVRFVVHYDIPKSLDGYYQETGRAGRDGGEGRCIAFYTIKDLQKLEKLMADKGVAEQEIGKQLLLETANYCESSVCRRKLLLHYFGETYPHDNCENCDNCLHPKTKIDAKEQLILALETIVAVKENFKQQHIIDILRGNETVAITAHHHDQLPFYGEGADTEETVWNAVINQALLSELIVKDIETYGLLHLTKAGHAFLKHPAPFLISPDNEFQEDDQLSADADLSGAADKELHAMLVDLRRSMARKLQLPPYVIFQDNSLDAMATVYPVTIAELRTIPGVGEGKAKRYGEEFCQLIKRHCEENEIERPTDMRVRTTSNRSKRKISIIQAIDRRVSLNDIALMHGLEFDELLDELETIVNGGTRINIDYFLEDEIDEDRIEDIYEYFRHSDTDDINTALTHLPTDTTDEEVRLVRIKFLSDMGN